MRLLEFGFGLNELLGHSSAPSFREGLQRQGVVENQNVLAQSRVEKEIGPNPRFSNF